MIAYKLNIIGLKLYEDPLQRRIYFPHICRITGDDISQYKETCEVLLDYPKIGVAIFFSKKAISNILHDNIDVHSRIIISEFP